MQNIRMLLVDCKDLDEDVRARFHQVKIEPVVTWIEAGNTTPWVDRYRPSQAALQRLRIATPVDWHVIVIGNNLGKGHHYARAVPEHMHGRTIIVWPESLYLGSLRYSAAGLRHMTSRNNLALAVLGVLHGSRVKA